MDMYAPLLKTFNVSYNFRTASDEDELCKKETELCDAVSPRRILLKLKTSDIKYFAEFPINVSRAVNKHAVLVISVSPKSHVSVEDKYDFFRAAKRVASTVSEDVEAIINRKIDFSTDDYQTDLRHMLDDVDVEALVLEQKYIYHLLMKMLYPHYTRWRLDLLTEMSDLGTFLRKVFPGDS